MKRRLVQQGAATLMVSIPAKWARKFRLKKGDEVEVAETEDTLVLSSEAKARRTRLELDVTNFYPLVKRIVGNKYIQGFDELVLASAKPELLKDIPDVVKAHLLGFEVVEQSKNRIVVKEVSHVAEEEFDVMLRRLFLLVKMMGNDLVTALKNKEDVDYVIRQDENVNRFANYCLRTINKRVRKSTAENCAVYTIVYLAENIADCYKKIAELEVSDKLIASLADINAFYSDFLELFYDFSVQKAASFGSRFEKLRSQKPKVSSAEDALFLGALQELLNYIILMFNNQLNYQVF